MRDINICVISGGSGNDALIKGLKKIYPESNVKVLVNAYDAGKSTGVCRQVTNTLGVSDIRKNHIRMYKALTKNTNQCIVEFYDARYNFTKGYEVEEIKQKLEEWQLSYLSPYVERFFERPESKNYDYNDFNVSNIVYAEMYAEEGYEYTNNFFTTDLLNIDDFVVLNSFDNIFIKGVTESGKVIDEEGDLVEYCNPDDIVTKMMYDLHGKSFGINPVAIQTVADADLIIISTGTFWSSIYPTLDYLDFYKYINESSAKKIWAINCEQDKDSYGVGSNTFIEFFKELGLDLNQFTILENADAYEILRQENNEFNVIYEHMGNNKGKHDGDLYARAILKCFYGISDITKYSNIIFDFDDTLWSRDYKENETNKHYSQENVKLVNKFDKGVVCIISGNSYSSISQKLATVYGTTLESFDVDIWADANSKLYSNGKHVDTIKDLIITCDTTQLFKRLGSKYLIVPQIDDKKYPTCIKIKPLTHLEQLLLADYSNNYLLEECGLIGCGARVTGTSTVDIVSDYNTKVAALRYAFDDPYKGLYIGDEVYK